MTAAHPATLAYEAAVKQAQAGSARLTKAEAEAARANIALAHAERGFRVTLSRVRRCRRELERLGLGTWYATYDSTPHLRPEHGRVWLEKNAPGLLDSEDHEDETAD